MTQFTELEQSIYDRLLELLHAIKQGDADTYTRLSAKDLTAIEPETGGQIVEGLPFHVFLIERSTMADYHLEVINPTIKVEGNMAYACYNLVTSQKKDDTFRFDQVQETRIFQRIDGLWKMIHFHRSA